MDKIVRYMLEEDEGFGDVTSNALIDKDDVSVGQIFSKEDGILAGIDIAREIFESRDITVIFNLNDGTEISKGDLLIHVVGNTRDILLLERTVLNLLMRMSGVATAANHYVNLVKDYDVIVAGTRKTAPAIAKFDKYALAVGGADTHRFSLDDMVLIKDNHIMAVGTPLDALKKAQNNVSFSKKIEIEVETLEDAIQCVENKADIVMLDNMDPSEVKEVLNQLNKLGIRNNSLIEVSGGINHETICEFAEAGVDIISSGALTHSTRSLNFGLDLKRCDSL
ncbi:putative nicotinate-nucleotide pyrophosphorylase [Methanobrevibacter woesei]|uniref:Nicotinate-nucleotide pyrophosphorylase [carboxylating] n=1 Tax=Methanobrevibacter woesei TaxID=190976 RepID=A0A2U1S953_9EURY|nr:carboxylating nicotinate-nucleotide diphosphorylase [Methanobrevibacter woesei]MCI7291918.1 carboxylating nicotinate-nucleotide diphosphorylase [Methanobrevibacter woesei]PWB86736.1 putative nicotinate-nucleotide pyrophosphorylase [Methanobrevibacter woesei]